MRRTLSAFAVLFVLSGCFAKRTVCESTSDCFADEVCLSGECSAKVVIDDNELLCDRNSCASTLTESTVCVGKNCVVTRCANNAVFCDDGCCEVTQSDDHGVNLSTNLVGNLDIVVTPDDVPHIFWFDFNRFTLVQRSWDGADWRNSRPAIFPPPLWRYDVAVDNSGGLHIVYTAEDSNLMYGRQNAAGGWETTIIHTPESRFETDEEPAFIEPYLTLSGTTPYGCVLFGTETQLLDATSTDQPEVWTFAVDNRGDFVTTRIPLDEPVGEKCSVIVDGAGRQYLYYAVSEADETRFLRYAERFDVDEEWTFDAEVPRIGAPAGHGALGFGPDGTVRLAYQVVEADMFSESPALYELRMRDGALVDQTNLDNIFGQGDDRVFSHFRYVGEDDDLELVWMRADVSEDDYRVGRAVVQADGEYERNAEAIDVPLVPGWTAFAKANRLHVVVMNPEDQKLLYFAR